jgi:hypothetical protein
VLTSCTWTFFPLKAKEELRAMTKSCDSFDKAVMISSEIPSAKYSCSMSPLILAKGNTAMEGLSGGFGGLKIIEVPKAPASAALTA